MKAIARLFKRGVQRLVGNRWVVAGCGFPYDKAYCTYHVGRRMALDFTDDYDTAVQLRDQLNENRGWFKAAK